MSCIFCRIIDKQIPASIIYEDEKAVAFLDIHPINEGHVLVVLKRHEERLSGLSEDEAGYLLKIGRKLLKAIQESGIKCEGANLFLSDGPTAGQEVMHSHLHIAPRFEGDGQRVGFIHSDPAQYPRARLDQIATAITDKLARPDKFETITQPTLETKRLILRPYRESDLADIFAYASHPEVSKFVPWEAHIAIEDSKKFLDLVKLSTRTIRDKLYYVFAVRLKESGQVVGSIDFKNVNPCIGQIDYALGFDFWNKGIMSEAAEAIRDWAFENLPKMVRLQAFCVADNVGSSRVMEKIGMTREGMRRKAFVLKGNPVDLIDYAIVRDHEGR
ncbi:MAG: GNAT family N-acetyltransferase [Bdellovibrionaceae bacterium]|nr:GNAT family N-acetyltransferase [Pseudobdellovibrionaceae bacterium]